MSTMKKRLFVTLGLLFCESESFQMATPLTRIRRLERETAATTITTPPPLSRSMTAAFSSSSSQEQYQQSTATCGTTTTTTLSPTQIEKTIVKLGRRGQTDQALELYHSLSRPSVRQWNSAIDACARSRPTRVDDCFVLFQEGMAVHSLQPNVFTFGALVSACSRARRAKKAIQVLKSMESTYGVVPNAVVYSSVISACARADPPEWKKALELVDECDNLNVVGYNAALSACARAGQWEPAIALLETMEASCSVSPDSVTYGTILNACEQGQQWQLLLHYAKRMESLHLPLDGISLTSILHACQQLGMATEALDYLQQFQRLSHQRERKTAGWQRQGVRKPLRGPDEVVYRLVISACARGGKWKEGIDLLQELRTHTGRPPDVVAYTAAMTGCEYAGEWTRACQLLAQMRQDGVPPNHVTMASVLGACAVACKRAATPQEAQVPKQKALQLLRVMKNDDSVVSPNIVVYNAAIRACGEALDLDSALGLLDELEADDLEPTVVTYGSLMTACERVGDLQAASKVFKHLRASEVPANEIIYGAAISCCRKAGDSERALLLLRKMIRQGDLSPNVATFNTVLCALAEGRDLKNAILVYKLLKSTYSKGVRPNRQTYNILIRGLAANQEPNLAEAFLRKMQADGIVPDVDLYTATVTAYEKTGQPLQALRLMESMEQDGYDFYDIEVLNTAFKKAVKLVNVVGRGLSSSRSVSGKESLLRITDLDEGRDEADGRAFVRGRTAYEQ